MTAVVSWDPPGMPANAQAPRLLSGPHPAASGSYGAEAVQWSLDRPGLQPKRSPGPRWWQRLVLHRALEHDEHGSLVWPVVVVSGPRQVGKSWLERVLLDWRIHQSERFGEPQDCLHVAHKLAAAREVWRPAARFERAAGANVRTANGEEMIELVDGSRWLIMAANDGAGVAFSLPMALVDEAWRVPRPVVDDAIGPTQAETESPQLWLVSTAGTSSSDLMMVNRSAALAELESPRPGSTLLVEWSAPPDPDLDIDDPATWRQASPHWDERRAAFVAGKRAKSTERAFRMQYLNQWVPTALPSTFADDTLAAVLTLDGVNGAPSLAVEVTTDRTSAVIVAAAGDVVEVLAEGEGAAWVAPFVRSVLEVSEVRALAVDGTGPAMPIAEELRAELGDKLLVLTGRQAATAHGMLHDALSARPPSVRIRSNSPAMRAAIVGAQMRRYGQVRMFIRDELGGASGAPLAAAALATWADTHAPETVERSRIF